MSFGAIPPGVGGKGMGPDGRPLNMMPISAMAAKPKQGISPVVMQAATHVAAAVGPTLPKKKGFPIMLVALIGGGAVVAYLLYRRSQKGKKA